MTNKKYNIRYYAIGHSYLMHGPFEGWQTKGCWGMAASEPSKDYYHQFQTILKENLDCNIESIAENHASYERICVKDVAKDAYIFSPEYIHMQDVLRNFKPNLITIFIGGGNTVAKDVESLTNFYDVLFEMIAREKQPETVVTYVSLNTNIRKISEPVVEKYGFLHTDASFIHAAAEEFGEFRENPYYSYKDYPEYDEKAKQGAVEFRAHPNNKGHRKIAEAIFDTVKESIITQVSYGKTVNEIQWKIEKHKQEQDIATVATDPDIKLSFQGFNIRAIPEGIGFSSAPGTGASLFGHVLEGKEIYRKLCVEMAVEGEGFDKQLEVIINQGNNELLCYTTMEDSQMHLYEFDISKLQEPFEMFRISPNLNECYIKVKSVCLVK